MNSFGRALVFLGAAAVAEVAAAEPPDWELHTAVQYAVPGAPEWELHTHLVMHRPGSSLAGPPATASAEEFLKFMNRNFEGVALQREPSPMLPNWARCGIPRPDRCSAVEDLIMAKAYLDGTRHLVAVRTPAAAVSEN